MVIRVVLFLLLLKVYEEPGNSILFLLTGLDGKEMFYIMNLGVNRDNGSLIFETQNDKLLSREAQNLIFINLSRRGIPSIDVKIELKSVSS